MARHENAVQFGPIVLAFTDRFDFRWNDKGSGGSHDGAFWQPKPPSGFYALGGLGAQGYDDQNGRNWALCVKESVAGNGALAPPKDYQRIWIDNGSGADRDGSCWRPLPPEGYVALGDVFMDGYDTKLSVDDVRCVRADLTTMGAVGDLIWNDVKTGSDTDFAAWKLAAPGVYLDSEKAALSANTFYGVASHQEPTNVVAVLAATLPVQRGIEPPLPALDSRTRPPETTTPQIDRIVTVPFTAVSDPDVTQQWQLQHSPFYDVERSVYYRLELYDDNHTSEVQTKQQAVEVGVSTTQSQTWEVRTGISVTYESGVSFIASATVSATISVELGFSRSTSETSFQSKTLSASLATPPDHAGALWDISYTLAVVRSDGTAIQQDLDFSSNGAFIERQFPPPSGTRKNLTLRHFPPVEEALRRSAVPAEGLERRMAPAA